MKINDRVILITGASAGIGKAAAVHLGKMGARLALAALSLVSRTARVELEKDKIVVSLVYPGLTATDFQKNSIKPARSTFSRGQWTLPQADPVEKVAAAIRQAIETEEAEIFLTPVYRH
ncbi:MAG: hypothetical protein JW969_02845 [Spirochaetales bacterium]|nr:hypothetical protein [Spirochaetales bacterium]